MLRQFVHSLPVSAHFIGARTIVSSWKHFIRSAGRSASCAAADARKKKLSARRGVDRKAGRFFSPRLRVLLWSFLPTREESGVPEMIESTIKKPANPQICRREALRMGLPQSPSVTALACGLGHAAALTAHWAVIHHRVAACGSPKGGACDIPFVAGNANRREARPHPSAASREIGVCHLPQRGRRGAVIFRKT